MTGRVPSRSLRMSFAGGLAAAGVLALLPLRSPALAQTYNSDGATHDPTKQSGWRLPAIDPSTSNYDNCLRCHQSGGPTGAADKSGYLFGGHKNMSRPADGKPWGMPGVDASHPASPELSNASLDPLGIFTSLWIQEDYVRPFANWTTASGYALSSVTGGYCAKSAAGDISSDDVPDLVACPTCESPVMGNGNAGYPLNYPDPTSCAVAASRTGKSYPLITLNNQPLYWVYGGAGLRGGPRDDPAWEPAVQVRPLPHDGLEGEHRHRRRDHGPDQASLQRFSFGRARLRDNSWSHLEAAGTQLRSLGVPRDQVPVHGGYGL